MKDCPFEGSGSNLLIQIWLSSIRFLKSIECLEVNHLHLGDERFLRSSSSEGELN